MTIREKIPRKETRFAKFFNLSNMKKSLKIILGFVFLTLAFSGCKLFGASDTIPETVLPKDSAFMITIDKSNAGGVDDLTEIFEKLPKSDLSSALFQGFWLGVEASLKTELEGDDLSLEDDFYPIFKGNWKVVMGGEGRAIEFLEDSDYATENISPDEYSFYFIVQTEEYKKVEKIVEKFGDEKPYEIDGVTVWKIDDEAYLGQYGDVFWVSTEVEDVEKDAARIKNEEGFNTRTDVYDELAEVNDEILASFYADGAPYYENIYEENDVIMAGEQDIKFMTEYDHTVMAFYVKGNGIAASVRSSLLEEDLEEEVYEVGEFAKNVPGENLVFYLEDEGLDEYIEGALKDGKKGGTLHDIINFVSIGINEWFSNLLARNEDISEEDLINYFAGEMAFQANVVNDGSTPAFALYVRVNPEQARVQELILEDMDLIVDAFMEGFNGEIVSQGGEEPLVKEILAINGQALRKVSLNWGNMPAEIVLQYQAMLGNVEDYKIELYYGLIEEDVFVVALYPDLPGLYGKSDTSVAENDGYNDLFGKKSLEGVFYYDSVPLWKMVDDYFALLQEQGLAQSSDVAMAKQFFEILRMAKSAYLTETREGDVLRGEIYLEFSEGGEEEKGG